MLKVNSNGNISSQIPIPESLCAVLHSFAHSNSRKTHTTHTDTYTVNFFFIVSFQKVLLFCIIRLSLDLISVLAKWTKQQHTHASCHQVPHIIGLLDLPLELILFALLLSFVLSLSLSLCYHLCYLFTFLSSLIALTPPSNPSLSLSCSDPLYVLRPESLSNRRYTHMQNSEVNLEV